MSRPGTKQEVRSRRKAATATRGSTGARPRIDITGPGRREAPNRLAVRLTLQHTNTIGLLVREQAGDGTQSAEQSERSHRTVGAYGRSAPVKTSRSREDGRRPSNRTTVETGIEPLTLGLAKAIQAQQLPATLQ